MSIVWRSGVVVCAIPYNRKFARFDSASSHSVATLDKFLTLNCKAPERSNSHLSNLIIWWHNMSTGRAFIAMSIIIISIFTNKVLVHWLSLVIISELSAITTFLSPLLIWTIGDRTWNSFRLSIGKSISVFIQLPWVNYYLRLGNCIVLY